MNIIIDTQEKLPFQFSSKIKTTRKSLISGDYSVKGFEDRITVERKSLDDLVGSLFGDRERFFKEISRLQVYRFKCVVVEANFEQVLRAEYFSKKVTPSQIVANVTTLILVKNIPVFFLGSPGSCSVFVESWLLKSAQKLGLRI